MSSSPVSRSTHRRHSIRPSCRRGLHPDTNLVHHLRVEAACLNPEAMHPIALRRNERQRRMMLMIGLTRRLSLALKPSMPFHGSRYSPLIELERTLIFALQAGILIALDQVEVADREGIELGPHEAAKGILRGVPDRLAANIEAGVDQHGTAGLGLEAGEQCVEARVGLGMNGLNAGRIVDVSHGGNI